MRILIALTYYHPYKSGLTVYAVRLAEALAQRGHQVTVLTSRHERSLPARETINGVEVVRAPVLLRISKGVVMPTFPLLAWRLLRQSDVVNLHLPQLDAAPVALLAKLARRPVLITYHCDLTMQKGLISTLANAVMNLASRVTLAVSRTVATNSSDYAEHSPFLRGRMAKVCAVVPPVEVAPVTDEQVAAFRKAYGLDKAPDSLTAGPLIGMVARLAAEKGVEYLVDAMPAVLERYPTAQVLYVGQHQNVLGEEAYARRLEPLIAKLGDRWRFLGKISDEDLAAFYRVIDVLSFASTNATESYGISQVEAMVSGTPVVASDLPGVRQPVAVTGMGKIVPAKDGQALARALLEILENPEAYRRPVDEIARRFSPQTVAAEYEILMTELIKG